jgi:hypothetical protein
MEGTPMSIISLAYEGHPITIRNDGWFNATQAAQAYKKEPVSWLRQSDTAEYLAALCKKDGNDGFLTEFNKIKELDGSTAKARRELLDLVKRSGYVLTKAGAPENGGGTWLHPKLAVAFARWLDVDFSIWCDTKIDDIIRGKQDWNRMRHVSVASAKLLATMVKVCRDADGKNTSDVHYMCEHKLVNWLLVGEFRGLDRDQLAGWQLDFLGHFDIRDSMLMARNVPYDKRKKLLADEAIAWRAKNSHRIHGSNDPDFIAA